MPTLVINGSSYPFPITNSENWGNDVTAWATAISQTTLQKNGGSFILTAELDLGTTYGIKAAYLKSRTANPADAGLVRAANNEVGISWRDLAGTGNLPLSASASNRLVFNGNNVIVTSSTDTLTNKTIVAANNTVTTAASGNLTSTSLNAALSELQTDIDTRVTAAAKLSVFAATTSAELKTVISDETGSGALVFATSPTLVTPALGTPASGVLTNATGLPITTGVSGLGSGVATFLATPSSANLAAAVTGETGTGALVFATSPALVTPALGTPASGVLTNVTGLPLTSGVTGQLPIANGGSGQATANTALNAFLPTQATHSGKVLQTDGTDTTWASVITGSNPTFTGIVTIPVGSAAAPSLTFTTDTTTGIYRHSAGYTGFSSAGVLCGYWGAAGINVLTTNSSWLQSNVGITYTTTVTNGTHQFKIVDADNSDSRYVLWAQGGGGTIESLVVTSSGKVGVGVAPTGAFNVYDHLAISTAGVNTIGRTTKIASSDYPGQSIVGKTDGVAVAAGYVGQVITASLAGAVTSVSGTFVDDAGTLALTSGLWEITICAAVAVNNISARPEGLLSVRRTSDSVSIADFTFIHNPPAGSVDVQNVTVSFTINLTAAVTYKLSVKANQAAAAATIRVIANNATFSAYPTNSFWQAKRLA